MKTSYDKYYKEEDYFGKPYTGLVEFFKNYEPKGTILDLGCGQGRDSIALGKLGFKVIGIDISAVGITQLNNISKELGLDVKGITGDLYKYKIDSEIDIIFMDSILHFYSNDLKKEKSLVERLIEESKPGTVICNCMLKGKKREKILKNTFDISGKFIDVLYDGYVLYPEASAEYHMYIVKN